jgi:hypothetical protein
MNSIDRSFMGIDLTGQRKNFTCAVLDSARHIVFCGTVTPLEWQALLNDSQNVIAAVNSPLTLNEGYMADDEYRQQLKPTPAKSRYSDMRVCEYQLLSAGLTPTRTPKDVGRFSIGLQKAFKFASELGLNGFQFWPFPNSRYQMVETFADAAYWALLGIKPFAANTLEGRIQRQLVLQSKYLPVADAMEFFEEITRHRLLTGKLPDEKILSTNVLNALIAAYTAWVVINRPAEYARIGEPDEGVIILPAIPETI